MGKRDSQILEVMTTKGRIEVSTLAEMLGVSSVTMRKDLDSLEQRGVILREHGYAVLASIDNIQGRLAYHYQTKLAIAKSAAELVSDGETVMIESGSCCCLLARRLAEIRRDVTIITNSVFIAAYVRDIPSAQVILLGGDYQRDAQVTVGPLMRRCASGFHVRSLFIGTDGYKPDQGFYNADHLRAEAVRAMADQVDRVIVLTESEKFSRHGVAPMDINSQIELVITDDGITAEQRASLEAAGIQILKSVVRRD